jgi:hypothetical protein
MASLGGDMTDRQNFSSWSEDEPRRASTGMKLVLFGALVPVFLVALLVGGFLLARGQADGAAVTAVSEAQLDCSSSRDAWRWACQKTGAATPSAAAAAAAGDGPSTTGSVEHKTGRSSSIKTATAEPSEPAKEPPKALPLVKAPVPPARPAEPDKVQQTASAAEPSRAAAEKAAETKPASRLSSAPPEEPVPAVAPRLAVTPAVDEKAPAAALASKPEESAKPERAARATAASRGRERRASVADDDDEKPARLARHRTRAKESARRTVAAVREKAARQRLRAARLRARDEASDSGDYRVSTTRTYVLPDGRRVMTYAQPRAEDVRELVAEHRARFGARRVASPYFGGPAYGGGWYGGSGEW